MTVWDPCGITNHIIWQMKLASQTISLGWTKSHCPTMPQRKEKAVKGPHRSQFETYQAYTLTEPHP